MTAETNTKNSSWSLALRYGGIASVLFIIITVVLELVGVYNPIEQKGTTIVTVLSIAFYAGAIYMATQNHRDQNLGGFMTYGQAFGTGFQVALVMALISGVYLLLQVMLIDPEMIDKMKIVQEGILEEQGMSADQIASANLDFFMSPGPLFIFGVLGNLVFGVLISLITSAILQKRHPNA
ncbi:MAG: DUF4199 domain-containing protein [Bacteroidota bacterium]